MHAREGQPEYAPAEGEVPMDGMGYEGYENPEAAYGEQGEMPEGYEGE